MTAQTATPINEFSIQFLSVEDGLSQGSNYFRYEDKWGFMWFTANDALNRYDGKMVKVYNKARHFINCPPLQQGYGFVEDRSGNLYVGSSRGMYIYHRDRDKFTLKRIFKTAGDSSAMPIGLLGDQLWCFNKSWDLAAYNIRTGQIATSIHIPLDPLPSLHIYGMLKNNFHMHYPILDQNGTIWLSAATDLACYAVPSKRIQFPLRSQGIQPGSIHFVSGYYDHEKKTIVYHTSKKTLVFDITTTAQIPLDTITKTKKYLHASGLEKGQYINAGIARDLGWTDNLHPNTNLNDFTHAINRLYMSQRFDRNQNLWLDYNGKGYVVLNFHEGPLSMKPSHSLLDSFIIPHGIQSFGELPNGDILVHEGLLKSKNKQLVRAKGTLSSLFDYYKSTDRFRNGLWYYRPFQTNLYKHFVLFSDQENRLQPVIASDQIRDEEQMNDLAVLNDGRILCCLSRGLRFIDMKQHTLKKALGDSTSNPFKINLLDSNLMAVSYIEHDMQLIRVGNEGKLVVQKNILPGIQSYYLQYDQKRQRYWAGTNQGIYLLNEEFQTVKRFDANNGLAGNMIYGLLLDENGNAWCSHQRGLSSIDANSFFIINYEKEDGIQDWDFNNRAFYKAKDGTMYFGGVSGFNYFKPPLTWNTTIEPMVYVDEIDVNDEVYLPDSNANLVTQLVLDARQHGLAFKVIVRDLVHGRHRKIIYRLQHNDRAWKMLPNESYIILNSLSPGTYTLELGYFDKFRPVQQVQKRILISIATPFYQRLWFVILVTVIISFSIFRYMHRIRSLREERKLQQQMALMEERKRITADLHDDIGSALSSLQLNSHMAGLLLDRKDDSARRLVNKIEQQASQLAERIGDFIWSMKPGKEEFMGLGNRIRTYVSDILGDSNIAYEIQLDKELDHLIVDTTVRKNLVLIVKEAVNNAAKYSEASRIRIQLQRIGQDVRLRIEDNGKGITDEARHGNGLSNMRKRAEDISALFDLETAPGKGTCISLTFPLSR